MPTATITSKGLITLPKEVRDALGLAAGDRVVFVAEAERTYKVVAVTRDVRHLKGLVTKPSNPVTVKAMNRTIARAGSGK